MAGLSSIFYPPSSILTWSSCHLVTLSPCHGLKPNFDDRPAGAVLEKADTILNQADIETHLGFRLQHADAPGDLGLLTRHQHVFFIWYPPLVRRARRDCPAVRVALGRAATVGVPVYTDAPKATWLDDIFAARD